MNMKSLLHKIRPASFIAVCLLSFTLGNVYGSSDVTQELKVLVVGETDSEKSSLINTIANLTSGKKSIDQKDFLIKTTFDGKEIPVSDSRYRHRPPASPICPYYFPSYDCGTKKYTYRTKDYSITRKNIKLTLFDSPGIPASESPEEMQEIIDHIVDKVKGSTNFDAIALVIPRLTPQFELATQFYLSLFFNVLPKEFHHRVFIVFTFEDAPVDKFFQNLEGLGINVKNYVKFDNSALFAHTPLPAEIAQEIARSNDNYLYKRE